MSYNVDIEHGWRIEVGDYSALDEKTSSHFRHCPGDVCFRYARISILAITVA
jgi:hypothetical protein